LTLLKRKTIFIALLIALAPAIVTSLLVSTQLGARLLDFHPAWSDEVIYWQEVNTFKQVGLNGGYFTYEELTAEADGLHFGNHGSAFPILFGSLARVFGWSLNSGPIYNLALLAVALFLAVLMLKPTFFQAVLILFMVALASPVLLYTPTTMQESLIHALAILIGAFILKLSAQGVKPWWLKVLAVLVVTLASLLRLTWVVAFVPIVFLLKENKSVKWTVISMLLSLAAIVVLYKVYAWWTAPYPDFFVLRLVEPGLHLAQRAGILFEHIGQNLKNTFSFGAPSTGAEILFRYQIVALMVLLGVVFKRNKLAVGSSLFILLASFVMVLAFYDVTRFRDYRILAPLFLIGVLVLIQTINGPRDAHSVMAYALILSNLLGIKMFLIDYQMHLNQFVGGWDPIGETYTPVFNEIAYQPGAQPWCNSLLTDRFSGENLQTLPAGIGLNLFSDPVRLNEPIQSHFIFTAPENLELWGISDTCEVLFDAGDRVLCAQTTDGCEK
jgi:hypothetical protein